MRIDSVEVELADDEEEDGLDGGQATRCVRDDDTISLYPDDAPDVQALVRSADRAMYRAKRPGKAPHLAHERTSDASLHAACETAPAPAASSRKGLTP